MLTHRRRTLERLEACPFPLRKSLLKYQLHGTPICSSAAYSCIRQYH